MTANDLVHLLSTVIQAARAKRINALLATSIVGIGSALVWLFTERSRTDIPYLREAFWLLATSGVVLLVWLFIRVARQAFPPAPPERGPVPSPVKGVSAFSFNDGELFWKLGRDREIQTLLGLVLDDQIPFVVMRGQSGAGKTSLLRAGLQYTLKERRKIPCVYWEARAAKPVEGLCHAIASELDIAQPANLRAFLAQTSSPVVLLIDQLEQLRQGAPDHQPVFDLFAEVFRRPAPHRLKIVVAFREHYDTAWLDFEEKAQILARKFHLKIFHPDLAVGIMATIMAEAELTVDQALLSKYAYSVAGSSGGVTPVDIGIGVLVLSNWAQRAHRERLGLEDYTTAGGAVGVLSAHVQECLSDLPEPDRPLLVKGLTLSLIDLAHDQRVSDGAMCAEIARHAGMDSRRLEFFVQNYLVTANARILEPVDGVDGDGPAARYRLAHDRLVPVFRQLAGETLAIADRTKLTFDEQYARWLRTQSSRYLLGGSDLRLALKHRSLLISGDDSANRASFLARSSRRRTLQRLAVGGACSILLGIVPIGIQLNKATDAHSRLESWRLPPDLYERQRELESLTIQRTPSERLLLAEFCHNSRLWDRACRRINSWSAPRASSTETPTDPEAGSGRLEGRLAGRAIVPQGTTES